MEFVVPLLFVVSFTFPSVSTEYLQVLTENINLYCYKRNKAGSGTKSTAPHPEVLPVKRSKHMEVSTTALPFSKDLHFAQKVAGEKDREILFFLLVLKDYAAIQVYQRLYHDCHSHKN